MAVMDGTLWVLASVLAFALLAWLPFLKPYSYWKTRGVAYETPWPLFGTMLSVIFQRKSMTELTQEVYKKHPKKRCVGLYQFLTPTMLLRDPELIKQITVKDFECFPQHTVFAPEEADPLWSKTLFAMPGGTDWKNLRTILSYIFTTNKLKFMFGLLREYSHQFRQHVSDIVNQNGGMVSLDVKEIFVKASSDIISTTAFGVGCDTFRDPDNDMFIMGKEVSNISGFLVNLKFFVSSISPALARFIKVQFISKRAGQFFKSLIKETVRRREATGIVRFDMVHMLMEARRGKLIRKENAPDCGSSDWFYGGRMITDDIMTSQALVFFLAGFDTIATAMSFAAYELALNKEIQRKLQREVDLELEKHSYQITYEGLTSMTYLDMVVSEVLRKWPPFAVTDRVAIQQCIVTARHSLEKTFILNKGVVCQVPIFAIHRDSKYFPRPEKFDPERFNELNRRNIIPYTYFPFGVGPRSCIGSRFALMEIKILLLYMVSKFEFVTVKKTQIPLVLSKSNINPRPEKGFWLGIKKRE